MVDLNVINLVLKKFLTASRSPGYLNKKEYEHLKERNKELYLSSAWFKSHWSFEKLKDYAANLVRDTRKFFVCGLPYQIAIKEGLLMREQLEDEMSERDWTEFAHNMEMCAIWFSDADGAFYSFDNISKTRKIRYPMIPNNIVSKISDKRIRVQPITENERRILSVDIALMASKKRDNDATSIFVNQLIPSSSKSNRYVNNIIYTENHEGLLTDQLALIVRRMYYEFECTDLVIDSKGVGHGVLEALFKEIYDPISGVTYEALSVRNNDELAERCLVVNAPKVIWAINNQNQQFNSDCAIGLREMFKQGRINLLISEFSADEELSEIRGYDSLSVEDKLRLQMPYINTKLLVEELINLSYTVKNSVIRVEEKSGARKDRYSSLSYNIWVSKQIEEELKKPAKSSDISYLTGLSSAPQVRGWNINVRR